MPCRSSRASICFLPRDNCERSRRPSGASGGAAGPSGFGARKILADTDGLGCATGFGTEAASTVSGFAARGLLRRGFVCLATLSHNARSSSLRLRLRRGGVGNSGMEVEERFIGRGDNDRCGGDAPRGPGRYSAGLPAVVQLLKPAPPRLSV